jgi:hypothetical protein
MLDSRIYIVLLYFVVSIYLFLLTIAFVHDGCVCYTTKSSTFYWSVFIGICFPSVYKGIGYLFTSKNENKSSVDSEM